MAIRAKFKPTPEGEFHPGIPAHNLSDEEYEALSVEDRKTVRESRIYDYEPKIGRATVKNRRSPRGDAAESEATSDDEAPPEAPAEPDDPVIDEPADAAEEGES